MIKNKTIKLCLIIVALAAILFTLAGCEKLTASLDQYNQEEVTEAVIPKSVPAAINGEPKLGNKSSSVTGNVVAQTKEEVKSTTYTVKMTANGFSPDKLYLKVGDTVIWENTRSGAINKAMIIGVRECSKTRSDFLNPGESFSWTFTEPMTCTIADGIMTTKESGIFVE